MDPTAQLDAILPLLNDLVRRLRPEQLSTPTPCDEFDVRQVLEHMVGGATTFAAAFRGEAPSGDGLPADVVSAFPAAMAELRSAVGLPGALDGTIASPFGDMPGEVFARLVVLDGLVHGWDIATATDQRYDPPAEVVTAVDTFARGALGGDRSNLPFAEPVEPPAGASPLTRLVAYTGRKVG